MIGYSLEWTEHLPPAEITAQEYDALPVDVCKRIEVVDGRIVMSPSPSRKHQEFVDGLSVALRGLRPRNLRVGSEVDVRLADVPLHNRRPDVVVYRRDLPDTEVLRPEHVTLVVEVVSPGSRTTDRIDKPGEYAAAGIPHYWRVELEDDDIIVHPFKVDASGRYVLQGEPHRGRLTLTDPFPVDLDLPSLLDR